MYLLECYVTNSSLNVNRPFTYYCDYNVDVFKRVKVIFNKSENVALVTGCMFTDKSLNDIEREYGYKILKISAVIDEEPIIDSTQFELAKWLSRTTISPLISCLNAMLPKALKTSLSIKKPKLISRIKLGLSTYLEDARE